MLKIGLTGGIASGKSAVADTLAELGASVIDTDLIARDVVAPGTDGLDEVVNAFGATVLMPDGALDRRALRDIVFADPARRRQLEALLHPRIRAAALEAAAAADGLYTVLVVPLLIETDFVDLVDRVLVVDCDPQIQVERVMRRDQCSAEAAGRIISSQINRDTRLAAADDIITNDGSREKLRQAVEALHRRYLGLAAAHAPDH